MRRLHCAPPSLLAGCGDLGTMVINLKLLDMCCPRGHQARVARDRVSAIVSSVSISGPTHNQSRCVFWSSNVWRAMVAWRPPDNWKDRWRREKFGFSLDA